MTPTWLATLDALKAHLDIQSELIEDGRYDEVAAFTPPADLPALPNILVARALDLLERAQALSELASALRDDTLGRLARSPHRSFTQRPISVYVDQQA